MKAALLLAALQDAEPSRWDRFVSWLLGMDRINLGDGEAAYELNYEVPLWVVPLVVVGVAGLAALLYVLERRDARVGPKVAMATLRALLVLLVLALLLGPMITVEVIKPRNGYVLLLVDDSMSMRKSDPPTRPEQKLALARVTGLSAADRLTPELEEQIRKLTRADIVQRVLQNPDLHLLHDIEAKLHAVYFTFSRGARKLEGRDALLATYNAKPPVGAETAIGDSIRQALSLTKGQPVVAVVVISDGRNNFGVEPAKVVSAPGLRRVPVYTVLAGIPQKPKDIALVELEAAEAVLVNDKLPIRFSLRSQGFTGAEVDVHLHVHPLREGEAETAADPKEIERILETAGIDQTAKVTLDGSPRQSADLVWQPRTPGEYLLLLRVPPQPEERTDLNNTLVHRVRVADDKIKVLYVEHQPRWEYRFLKNALIRDPKILVHCLLTGADEGFPQEHTRDASEPDFREPLREFPQTLKELVAYDVLILGDVDPGRLGGRDVWENAEKFVSNFGGGLVFISGTNYNPRAFKDTPLQQLLPVVPDETRLDTDLVYDRPFGYKLTPEALDPREGKGGAHPIIRFPVLGHEIPRIVETWEDNDGRNDGLPGVRWFQRVSRLKPTGKVLVEVKGLPASETGGRAPPLFVTMPYGDGRVFWSGTDETWLWRYLAGDSPWFYPFWQQAMYWTRYGKLLGTKRYRLRIDRHDKRYSIGREVAFYAAAFDKNFEPLSDPELTIYLEPPRGGRETVTLLKERDRHGYYEGKVTPKEVGLYRAWAGDPDDEASRSTEKFTVFVPNREEDEPILDEEELRRIAHAAHPPGEETAHREGECPNFFSIEMVAGLPQALKESKQNITEIKTDDLWDSPLAYILFAILITTEWILRKAFRML